MEDPIEGPQFLKNKYNLHNTPEVDQAAQRAYVRTGEVVPQDPLARIQNYLNRFKEIVERPDPERRAHGVQAIKEVLLDSFVTKFKDIPNSYWQTQERILREQGQQGDYDQFTEEEKDTWKKELSSGLIEDQRASLEQWVDYFASSESGAIPDYIKYWVFRSVVQLQEYDKESQKFPKRSKGTLKNFPDINNEALAYIVDAMVTKTQGKEFRHDDLEYELSAEQIAVFQKALQNENFAQLYGWANEIIQPIPEHLLPKTEGVWRTFKEGSDHNLLVQSVRGKGTGWCTAGETYAAKQLEAGDFHIFFSNDEAGNPIYPRIAIRMERDNIAEVRGIAARQNLDSYMVEVLTEKLDEFPDKNQYLKKEADMRRLTHIERKTRNGQALDKQDLEFLYEIDSSIEGFGYIEDPRIEELRTTRTLEEDMTIMFECRLDQIAWRKEQIRNDTKAYIGPLFPGVFALLRNIDHIYTSFPEERLLIEDLEIGGETKEELDKELTVNGVQVDYTADDLFETDAFITLPKPRIIRVVQISGGDLDLVDDTKTSNLFPLILDYGLEYVPYEAGPKYLLKHINQPGNRQTLRMGMELTAHRTQFQSTFYLEWSEGKRHLASASVDPDKLQRPGFKFLFMIPEP